MDFQSIITAITTVGFPIVVCLIMIYLNEKKDERHINEMNELKVFIENNTISLTKLVEKLEVLERG